MIDQRDTAPIPGPKGYPIVGNVTDIDPELPIASLQALAKQYGEIFSLTVFGRRRTIIASQRLLNEVCDEKRFGKAVKAGLAELRAGITDGLFTAHNDEKNWMLAHKILVPAFGPLNITNMFTDMKDIASQLILKWARYGPDHVIPVTDDFTRLTLDTLALCAMGYRFNSFYSDDMHPFISAMTRFLQEGGARSRRPTVLSPFYRSNDTQFHADIAYMRELSDNIVRQRVDRPNTRKDLLNAMLHGKDPRDNEKLPHDNITSNMITFLIAGHETTSGLLSFLFYHLLKHPETYRKAQEEVDAVVGKDSIKTEHLTQLPYVTACLRESLRLQPTAPAFTVAPQSEHGELVGGKYFVPHDEAIFALLPAVHRDPAVYGGDAEEFKPERMLEENFNNLPSNSWKPFGNGARGCIGRPFAWQEALLVTSMVLQYFNVVAANPRYDLQIKSTLTIKPKDFEMKATLREGWTPENVEQSLAGSIRSEDPGSAKAAVKVQPKVKGKPFIILYGSNSGTCEAFAQTLAADAAGHGFTASKIDTLDSAKQNLPKDEPVIIVTASYEGQPCDNAAMFYDWLQNMGKDEKITTPYAVFGCGHSDWKQTFHRIPNNVNRLMKEHGASPICDQGSADAAKGDMMSVFQMWEDDVLWPALKKQAGVVGENDASELASMVQNIDIEVSTRRASRLRTDVSEAMVVAARSLTAPGVPEKRHIELQLPSEMTYRAGDYLAVLPLNPISTTHRVAKRFRLPWDAILNISAKTGTHLPTDVPIAAHSVFSAYVELGQPATRRNVSMLIEASDDEKTTRELTGLLEGDFNLEITSKRITLLDLLEKYPTIQLPLAAFVASLIPMRVQQYSISSSPLADARKASLTYAVLDEESTSGHGRHIGVATNYLSLLHPGDIVHVAVRPSNQAFHLPTDAENIPVIMAAAGTGLAPFRAFIQERAAMIGAGRKLAPAHLYIGCRHPAQDELYPEDMAFWQTVGAVTIHHAFSRAPEKSAGFKYIDEAMRADADLLTSLWDQNAKVYVCGSRDVGESVKRVCLDLAREASIKKGKDVSDEALDAWFDRIRNERYSTDVFA